jgi:hypothetical protein
MHLVCPFQIVVELNSQCVFHVIKADSTTCIILIEVNLWYIKCSLKKCDLYFPEVVKRQPAVEPGQFDFEFDRERHHGFVEFVDVDDRDVDLNLWNN